jgi:hypothetical protein
MSDRSLLREFRVDVVAVLSLIAFAAVVVAMYRFDFSKLIGVLLLVAESAVTFVATMARFRRERQLIAEFAGTAPAETAVVTSALTFPGVVHPQFFLERRPGGLSFRRVGGTDSGVLVPWSEIRSIESPRAGSKTRVTIAFHQGRPFRFVMVPARPVSGADGRVVEWLRDGSEFPLPYAAADYLLPRTSSGGA